jgi:hypothetical protein
MTQPVRGVMTSDGKFYPEDEITETSGYMTASGKFFAVEAEAELYEAEHFLRREVQKQRFRPEQVLQVLRSCHGAVTRYLEAMESVKSLRQVQAVDEEPIDETEPEFDVAGEPTPRQVDSSIDTEDDEGASEDDVPVQQLPPGVGKPVPDVGRHIQPTPIRNKRPVHGTRGRRNNASGVRDD